jgi:hypothetical protein
MIIIVLAGATLLSVFSHINPIKTFPYYTFKLILILSSHHANTKDKKVQTIIYNFTILDKIGEKSSVKFAKNKVLAIKCISQKFM